MRTRLFSNRQTTDAVTDLSSSPHSTQYLLKRCRCETSQLVSTVVTQSPSVACRRSAVGRHGRVVVITVPVVDVGPCCREVIVQ